MSEMKNGSLLRRNMTLVLMVVGAGTCGVGWWLRSITLQQQDSITHLKIERKAIGEALDAVRHRLETALNRPKADGHRSSVPSKTELARAIRAKRAAQSTNPAYNPAKAVARLAAARSQRRGQYQAFFLLQHLTDDQATQLVEILARADEDQHELLESAQAQGVAPTSPDFFQVIGPMSIENQKSVLQAESDLLGSGGVSELKKYQTQMPVRHLLSEFAGQEALAGTPLSFEQAEALVPIVAGASGSYQKGADANTADIDWDYANRNAAAVLSPQQWAVFTGAAPDSQILANRAFARFNQSLYHALTSENAGH